MERTISSLTHPIVKHLVALRDDGTYREINNSVMIQGSKMIRELGREQELRLLLAGDRAQIPEDIKAAEIILADDAVIQKISGVVKSEGLVAEITRPSWSSLETGTKILALDGVSDPGNVGTLLRTALALGWHGVYFLEGSCDPFNDKALRAAMGATFRIPMAKGDWPTLRNLSTSKSWKPLVADLEGIPIEHASWNEGVLLVLGSESKGPSLSATNFCSAVTIPMSGAMESLNVGIAGAIMMYALGRMDQL